MGISESAWGWGACRRGLGPRGWWAPHQLTAQAGCLPRSVCLSPVTAGWRGVPCSMQNLRGYQGDTLVLSGNPVAGGHLTRWRPGYHILWLVPSSWKLRGEPAAPGAIVSPCGGFWSGGRIGPRDADPAWGHSQLSQGCRGCQIGEGAQPPGAGEGRGSRLG